MAFPKRACLINGDLKRKIHLKNTALKKLQKYFSKVVLGDLLKTTDLLMKLTVIDCVDLLKAFLKYYNVLSPNYKQHSLTSNTTHLCQ